MRTGYHSGMVIAVVDDLLFSSKIRSVADHAGVKTTFVRSRAAVGQAIAAGRPTLVILDLDRDALEPIGVIADIRASADAGPTRIVGFVRHTNVARIAEARAAGADLVLARSAFFPALGDMLSAVSAS